MATSDSVGSRAGLSGPGTEAMNVGGTERLLSVISGSLVAFYGLSRNNLGGFALALLGGGLVLRGVTGKSIVYKALDIDTAHSGRGDGRNLPDERNVRIAKAVTINRSPEDLYRFWRDFENLPRFMGHLQSVQIVDERRSRWAVKSPGGGTAEWLAEIVEEKENERIAWRSLEGSDVANAGLVRFSPAPDGGTQVQVTITYEPPAGKLGVALAWFTGEEPSQQLYDDLRRFKQLMEAGEIVSTDGQPTGQR
ncbi:MAG: SRPBCC family protein [Aphanocapsa lilacina HA4352-LM1]|nr:SRPBCC family protein [Aphanocapsa lilacina HA4352-LM1]